MNRLAYAFYQDANPLAAKEYAKLLWKSDIKDTASAVYLSAMINARVDSLHCADKTAHYAFANNMKAELTPIIQHLKTVSQEEQLRYIQIAKSTEIKRFNAQLPNKHYAYTCQAGMKAVQWGIKNALNQEENKEKAKEIIQVHVNTSTYEPEYVDDEVFYKLRLVFLENYYQSFNLKAEPSRPEQTISNQTMENLQPFLK